MESDQEPDPYSLPKLPPNLPEPSGISTPPLQTAASVPFRWEEQPGKPRPCTDVIVSSKISLNRRLDLPPRLAMMELQSNVPLKVKGSNPAVNRLNEFDSDPAGDRLIGFSTNPAADRLGGFSTNPMMYRLDGFKSRLDVVYTKKSSPTTVFDGPGSGDGGGPKTNSRLFGSFRLRRNASVSKVSSRSKFLTKIYEGFKQVVPWRKKSEMEGFTH